MSRIATFVEAWKDAEVDGEVQWAEEFIIELHVRTVSRQSELEEQ